MRPLFLAAVLSSVLAAGWAGTIYDNGVPITDPNSDCHSSCPDLVTSTGQAVFTLLSSATVTSVRFWTFESAGAYNGGTLEWQIFQDSGGVQGALIASDPFTLSQILIGTVDVAGLQLTEYQNDFSVASLTIDPSSPPQTYFLDIADFSGGTDSHGIFWATSGLDTLAFQLYGSGNQATPEPAGFALLTGGLACICCALRAAAKRRAARK